MFGIAAVVRQNQHSDNNDAYCLMSRLLEEKGRATTITIY